MRLLYPRSIYQYLKSIYQYLKRPIKRFFGCFACPFLTIFPRFFTFQDLFWDLRNRLGHVIAQNERIVWGIKVHFTERRLSNWSSHSPQNKRILPRRVGKSENWNEACGGKGFPFVPHPSSLLGGEGYIYHMSFTYSQVQNSLQNSFCVTTMSPTSTAFLLMDCPTPLSAAIFIQPYMCVES